MQELALHAIKQASDKQVDVTGVSAVYNLAYNQHFPSFLLYTI
jgi:hypothetical protein